MREFDVIIVGRGITGLSAALHLKRHGIKSVCLIGPNRQFTNCTSMNAGYASVSLNDNISRFVHGYGSRVAQDLLHLNYMGYRGLNLEAMAQGIMVCEGQTYRTTTSDMEINEMNSATSWLENNGFPAFIGRISKSHGALTFQSDGAASASLDISALMDRMESGLGFNTLSEQVVQIDPNVEYIKVTTSGGKSLRAQLVVTANHTGIKKLIPKLESCLINHADQWGEFTYAGKHPLISPGNLIFSNFGQYWLSVGPDNKIRAGGGRYLRKWAGVEANQADVNQQISEKVQEQLEETFSLKLSVTAAFRGILDLRACDEIPIIGPMYDDSRILVASGFMGSGLTFGFAAGIGLAEFIALGQSKSVPETFHPKRLRSLPDAP